MTTEQKEAIDLVKCFTKKNFSNENGWTGYYDTELKELQQAIEAVLNLIQEQEKETEKYKNLYQKALDDAVTTAHDNMQKDKMVNLMSEQLAGLTIFDIDKEEPLILGDKEEVKQYFERKVENESNDKSTYGK